MNVYIGTSGELKNAYIGEYTLNQGLLAYRPFETNANDISGNGYNGTVKGCSFGSISGKNGVRLASSFGEPSSNYITTTFSNHTLSQTFIIWVYQLGLGNDWTEVAGTETSDSGSSLRIRFNSSQNLRIWSYGIYGEGGNYANNWTMLSFVMTSGTTKFYVNKTLTSTDTGTNNFDASGNLHFGTGYSWQGGLNQRCFPGWIRHCAVYNRALSDTEISQFYDETV